MEKISLAALDNRRPRLKLQSANMAVDPTVVRAVVQQHIQTHGYDGSLTARVVREETERRCGLPPGGLADQKEDLMKAIEAVLGEQPKQRPQTESGEASVSAAECASTRAAVETDPEERSGKLKKALTARGRTDLLWAGGVKHS